MKLDFNKIKKVAIIRRNGLGDLLVTLSLIQYCRKQMPSAKITLFVEERNAVLLSYINIIDHCCIIPKKGNKYITIILAALKFRKEKFDLAISGHYMPHKIINLFLFALGAKNRVAYVDKSWHSSHLINCKVNYNKILMFCSSNLS